MKTTNQYNKTTVTKAHITVMVQSCVRYVCQYSGAKAVVQMLGSNALNRKHGCHDDEARR
jgi:hypothetical protein